MKKTVGKEGSLRKRMKGSNRISRDSSSSYVKGLQPFPEASHSRALSL